MSSLRANGTIVQTRIGHTILDLLRMAGAGRAPATPRVLHTLGEQLALTAYNTRLGRS